MLSAWYSMNWQWWNPGKVYTSPLLHMPLLICSGLHRLVYVRTRAWDWNSDHGKGGQTLLWDNVFSLTFTGTMSWGPKYKLSKDWEKIVYSICIYVWFWGDLDFVFFFLVHIMKAPYCWLSRLVPNLDKSSQPVRML